MSLEADAILALIEARSIIARLVRAYSGNGFDEAMDEAVDALDRWGFDPGTHTEQFNNLADLRISR